MYNNGRGIALTATRRPEPKMKTTPKSGGVAQDVTALVFAIVINFIVLANVDLPIVRPVLGFWFALVLPSYLLFTMSAWRRIRSHSSSIKGYLKLLSLL